MKLAKFGLDLSISLVLTLGVSYQVRAHGLHSHTAEETITDNLTEETITINQAQAVDFPLIDFPKITSPPRGEAFDFPDVTPNPDSPLPVLFAEGEQISFLKTTEDTNGQFRGLQINKVPLDRLNHNIPFGKRFRPLPLLFVGF
ncbi:hypothetical protein [Moorena sp. SIO4A5]|uniref:hypothetical protein n=1 Tax=Moorena sp. SIO4A5 TaxID=2607838 RepID=UPI0013CBE822|nr:hypothetical protein [Moorena sp. SIO4A5]NEO18527.1 hypothetical protein [Moorena sp. SIO4A5]